MSVVVIISGRGSNLQALLDGGIAVSGVISNVAGAGGLAIAASRGVRTEVLEHKAFPNREAFDDALAAAIDRMAPKLVALAGFMRVLGPAFVQRFAGRLVNIHPSLLPAFTGLHTHRRALAAGVKLHGCTVHFVTAELDHGPIIAQAAVPVHADDTEETLAARVLREEHVLYSKVIRWVLEGRLVIADGVVLVRGGDAQATFPAAA
jgi:phosphoribosylglycinamide formyltransferase-1